VPIDCTGLYGHKKALPLTSAQSNYALPFSSASEEFTAMQSELGALYTILVAVNGQEVSKGVL